MKFPSCVCLVLLAVIPVAHADEAHAKAIKQVVESFARLDGVYLAVHAKKSPLRDLETELLAARDPLVAAASAAGLSAEVAREIQAFAAHFEKTARLMATDTAPEQTKFFRAGDDLAWLSRMADTLGGTIAPAARLTPAERRELGQQVESLFGKKVVEFPRGDTAPFGSGSRSPFAHAMWFLNLAFDVTVKR